MDKKEYIERGALRDRMFNYYSIVNENTSKENYRGETLMAYEVADMIEDCIDNAPAADVVEVRHGEWIESTHWGEWYYDCPFCDDGFATRGRCETLPNFCSNCGAKLTGAKMDATDNNVGDK